MTLIEAMKKAKHGDTIQSKYICSTDEFWNGCEFKTEATIEIYNGEKWFVRKNPIRLEDLKADNWEILK